MIESYKQSVEEFKRVDHLYHVSLKYTRTVDVIRSVIERLIATFEHGIDALLKCLKEEKAIPEIPDSPVAKGTLMKEKCEDDKITQTIQEYLLLRKLMRAEYTKREEFRRHVTMIVDFGGQPINIDIDKLKEYYDDTAEFLKYARTKVAGYKDD
jgi:hypothetical protein